jgi:pyruvate-ferredoxin/flavodoxin oxidoreductase
MLFRRKRMPAASGPAGPVRFGIEAVLLVEERIGARVSIQARTAGALATAVSARARSFSDGLSAAGYAFGRAVSGRRAAVILDPDGLRSSEAVVSDAVRARTPLVVHLVCHDDWSAALSAGAAGAVVLVTPDIRDVAAIAVAAHRIAEEVLLPVVCVHDSSRIALASADIPEPSGEALSALLPDRIDVAGWQRRLFEAERPAVPEWLSPDRPLGIGARLDGIDDVAASAGRELFLDADLGERVDRSLAVVSEALGRSMRGLRTFGSGKGAPWIVTAGPLAGLAAVLAARAGHPVRSAACVRLVPFPSEAFASAALDGPAALLLAAHPGLLADSLARAAREASGRRVLLGLFAGGSGLPSTADLEAVARAVRSGAREGPVFVGAMRPQDRPGIPEAERLEQQLRAERPDVDRRLLHAPLPEADVAFCIATGPILSDLLQDEAAQAIAGTTGRPVRTVSVRTHVEAPASGLAHGEAAAHIAPSRATVIVAEAAALLDRLGIENTLATGGAVLVPDPEHLSYEAAGRIRRLGGRLFGLAPGVDPANPLEAPIRLLHCMFALLDEGDPRALPVTEAVVSRLHSEGILSVRQTDSLLSILPDTAPSGPLDPESRWADPRPPSGLHGAPDSGEGIDDPGHFWRTFGFAHASGRYAELAPDPHRTVAAMPIRAGWAPAASGRPPALPRLVPELCTGCGNCWTVCPESAILPVAPSFQAVFDTAFARLAAAGGEAFQLGRVSKPLVQEAYRIFRDDALGQYRTLDRLVAEALDRVMTRANLEAEKRSLLSAEFEALSLHIPALGLAHTEPWFDAAESTAKGSGRALLLAVDPDRCTACGACVAACPESALEPVTTDNPTLAAERLGAAFAAALPPLPADVIEAAASVEPTSRGLDHRAPGAAAGGDDAPLRRASIRAVAIAAEALRGPAIDRLTDRVRAAREALEAAIRAEMSGTVSVNDFEAFSKRLATLGEAPSADRLAAAAAGDGTVDAERLQRLADTRNETAALEARLTRGEGRARIVGVLEGQVRPTWPLNPYGFPWIRVAQGSGPAVVRAIADDLLERHLQEIALVRHAESLAGNMTEAARPPAVDPASVTGDEALAWPVPLLITDHLSAGLVALLEGKRPVRVALLRSDPTDPDAGDPAIAAAALGSACVVQGSLGDVRHLVAGLEAALTSREPSLVSLHAPTGPAPDALARARAAIRARIAPLLVYRPSASGLPGGTLDLSGNPSPGEDFAVVDGSAVTPAHWIAHEPAFRPEFAWVARGNEPTGSTDVSRLLDGSVDEGIPIIADPRGHVAVVPPRHLLAARRRLKAWRRLRAMAASTAPAVPATHPAAPGPPATPSPPPAPAVPADVHARLTARLLALSGFAPGLEAGRQPLRTLVSDSTPDEA